MISHGARDLQTSHDFDQIAENCFDCVSIDERFLSVSVDLVLSNDGFVKVRDFKFEDDKASIQVCTF